MNLPSEYLELLERGQSLQVIGLNETGLLKEDALAAVAMLEAADVPILGGDVWLVKGDTDNHANYDVWGNWATQRRTNEADDAYAARSWDDSRRYIEAGPDPQEGETHLFVLVP